MLAWSNAGARMGWLSSDTVPSLIWLQWMKTRAPHHIIDECTPAFDHSVFEVMLSPQFKAYPVTFCPRDLGVPTSRMQKYTQLVSKSLQPVHTFQKDVFAMLAFRACVLDGGVYFCAPVGMIADHVRAMAEKRGLCGNSKLNWLAVMDAGSRVRVEKYIEAVQQKRRASTTS